MLRFFCVAIGARLWRRRSSLLRSSHDGFAHCFASLASQTTCACGAVGPFASLVTWRRRSSLRFFCVVSGVCLWRRRSFASLVTRRRCPDCFASLALQTACASGAVGPFASLLPDGDARCFASLALQTACACGVVVPFALLATRRRRSLLRSFCVASGVCLRRRRSVRFARHMTALL